MEPKQKTEKLVKYRRKLGILQAFGNVSNKILEFVDEDHEVEVIIDMEQHMTLKLTNIETYKSMIVTHCITTCNLFDLGFKGSIYTWWNGRAEDDCIFKRLDRYLANIEFQQMWPALKITHLPKIGSDHCPILITGDPSVVPIKKTFRFLHFWIKHPSFHDVVRQNRTVDLAANPFILFNHKLKKVLSIWSKTTYGDIFQKIAGLEEVVLVHESQSELNPTRQNRERLHKVQAELIRYLALEEEFWKQKSRI
ncbi:PREDICTED: uncharacterized protein LOC109230185 [Nicotiana attenuata]|uniref:uncharacterized protein LOC109230185 n=1 Tax=Nicotiana attenuata TaxID=49451 RepID=UPI0009052660|nr:PREDICTED: uncharacterized protein LOC109230185 [Nicotiana attenuata]